MNDSALFLAQVKIELAGHLAWKFLDLRKAKLLIYMLERNYCEKMRCETYILLQLSGGKEFIWSL